MKSTFWWAVAGYIDEPRGKAELQLYGRRIPGIFLDICICIYS